MKTLSQHITERLQLNKDRANVHRYFPKTKEELQEIIKQLIEKRGIDADLNDIDTSKITDMSDLFLHSKNDNDINPRFDGDISKWDVSNVTNMNNMFQCSIYSGKNGDISKWDVSNVVDMGYMFNNSEFDGDVSDWNVNKKCYFSEEMFKNCPAENNLPAWYTKWLDSRKKY